MLGEEFYFETNGTKRFDQDKIQKLRSMELEICENSDYVIFPWETTENFVRKYVYNGNNLLTVRFGCYPKDHTVQFASPPSIVSLGGPRGRCQNAELLAHLTNISPYRIDAFGNRPDSKLKLNYMGFASSVEVLYNYQFGVNTVSKDVFRKNHFSSRVISYLAYGLPVLSPDWMRLSYDIKGCLPYNEDNFVSLVDKYSEKQEWQKLSKQAFDQAVELDWNNTLKPLEKIIAK